MHVSPSKTYAERLGQATEKMNLDKPDLGAYLALSISTVDNMKIVVPMTGTVTVKKGLQFYVKVDYEKFRKEDFFDNWGLPSAPGSFAELSISIGTGMSVIFELSISDIPSLTDMMQSSGSRLRNNGQTTGACAKE